jgi:cytochrome c biogenesis protein CcmG, thiol:disulfide interchange protein DsbE
MKSLKFLIPLALFGVLLGFLFVGLSLKPREVPSPLINKPAPEFSLPKLDDPSQQLGRKDMLGQVWVLNVWASWCVPCQQEHPLFVQLGQKKLAPIVGLNYKDQRADAMRWLARWGNPYLATVSDLQGKVGIDWGVYGVPETFIIDKQGTIRFKHIGPVTPEVMREQIEPMLKQLQAASGGANPA